MPKQETTTQTAVRLPNALLERLDKIAARMSPQGVRVTRAEVHRRAVFLGVKQLEDEAKKR